MTKILTFGLTAILSSVLSVSSLQAQFGQIGRDNRGDRVCVYEGVRYQGWEQCFGPREQIADLRGHNNRISSIRIFGRGSVTIYDDTNFRGYEMRVNNDIPDLSARALPRAGILSRTWNDSIQSLRVSDVINSTPRTSREPRDGVCVYDRVGFQGRSECWSAPDNLADLTRTGGDWSDRISSIRIYGRTVVELYSDTRFRGERLTVDRDIPDLSQYRAGPGQGRGNQGRGRGRGNWTWNDQVSSIRVISERRSTDNRR
jgi:hypothetical protein